MKIVTRGTTYRNRFPALCKCDRCDCEFEWMPTDVESGFTPDGHYSILHCPECKEVNDVPGWFQSGNLEMKGY